MLPVVATLLLALHSILPSATLVSGGYVAVSRRASQQQPPLQQRGTDIHATYESLPISIVDLKINQDNKAAMLYDNQSGTVLYAKNADAELPIASITKVMTALVILQNHGLDETVTIPQLAPQTNGSQAMGIVAGEQFKLSEALIGMLTYSANDMAQALAIWDSGSEQKFVAKMNDQARFWNLNHTRYVDATGLASQGGHSSARDLTTLATIVLHSNFFRQATSQPRYSVATLSGKRYYVTTTNKLLGTAGVVGTKTGYTLEAGECLLSLTQRQGHEIIGVILGSSDRFGQTKALLNASYSNYTWK